MPPRHRQLDVERRADVRTRLEPDAPAVLLHDRVGHGQPETGALADLLRREERIEDLRLQLVGNARPVVVDFEHDRFLIRVVPRAHDERSPRPLADEHRLLGVDDQVQQHLLHLVAVGEDLRQARRERVDDGDVRDALLVGAQRQRLAHHLVDVDHRARRLPLARERQQVADDARGALRFAEDRLEAAADRVVERRSLRQPLGPAEDRRQRVVQLVRDAGDRLARAPPSSRPAAAGDRCRASRRRASCAR